MHCRYWFCLIALMAIHGAQRAAAAPPAEQLLPESSRAVLLAPSAAVALRSWRNSQYRAFVTDRQLSPFLDDLTRQIERGADLAGVVCACWDELTALAGDGPAAVALVPTGERTAVVGILDVTGRAGKRNAFLRRIGLYALETKGKLKLESVGGESVLALNLPASRGAAAVTLFLHFKDDLLIIADDAGVVASVLTRWGVRGRSVVDSKEYLDVLARARFPDGRPPHLTWFVKPFADPKSTGPIEALTDLGFSDVTGIGGATRLGGNPLDMHSRVFIHAPRQEKSLKLLNFPNRPGLAPGDWVPAAAASCQTFQWDMRDLLSSIAPIFDRKTGKKGDFQAVVRALKEDPDGPRVDVQADIIARLSGRVTLITDCAAPVPDAGGRTIVAFETRDEKALARAFAELRRGEDRIMERTVAGTTLWEIRLPARKTKDGHPVSAVLTVAVTRGHLFAADDADFLESVLARNTLGASLDRQADYQKVNEELGKLGLGEISFRSFVRSAEQLRGTYELIRTDRLERGRTPAAQLLRWLLEGSAGSGPVIVLKGKLLPEFGRVSGHLKNVGAVAVTLPDGWLITAISLNSAAEKER